MSKQINILQLKKYPKVAQLDPNRKTGEKPGLGKELSAGEESLGEATIKLAGLAIAAKGIETLKTRFENAALAAGNMVAPIENFNKLLGTTTTQSALLLKTTDEQAKILKGTNISEQSRLKNAIEFGKLIPGQVGNIKRSNDELGKLNAYMTEMVQLQGVSSESAGTYSRYLYSQKEDSETIYENLRSSAAAIEMSTGELSVFKDMMNATGKVSAETRQTFRGSAEELAKAAFAAERVGTTLEESRTSGVEFLNLQSSLEKEMTAMQFTGINQAKELQQIRLAAASGDYDKIAKIQADLIVKNFEEVKKRGPMAMNAYAASIGLTTNKMAEMFETQTSITRSQEEYSAKTLEELKTSDQLTENQERILEIFNAKAKEAGYDVENITAGDITSNSELNKLYQEAANTAERKDIRSTTERSAELVNRVDETVAQVIQPNMAPVTNRIERLGNQAIDFAKDIATKTNDSDGTEDGNDGISKFLKNTYDKFLTAFGPGGAVEMAVYNGALKGTNDANSGITTSTSGNGNNKNNTNP